MNPLFQQRSDPVGGSIQRPICRRPVRLRRLGRNRGGLGRDADPLQRLLQIGDQVLGFLEPDGQAQQIRGHRRRGALDARPVLDQAFDAAEGGRPLEHRDRGRRGHRPALTVPMTDREHAAEAAGHLTHRHGVAGMIGQSRVQHRGNARMSVEMTRDQERTFRAALDPHEERTHAAQQQPGLERPQDRTRVAAPGADALPEGILDGTNDRASQHVAVTVQVLAGRMHHQISAELQRTQQHRRRSRAVDGEAGPGRVRDVCRRGDVGHVPRRVRRAVEPDQPGLAGPHCRRQGVQVGGIDELDLQPPRHGEIDQPGAQRPIHDTRGHHVIARQQGLEDGRRRRHARSEEQAIAPAFQGRQQLFRLVIVGLCGRV